MVLLQSSRRYKGINTSAPTVQAYKGSTPCVASWTMPSLSIAQPHALGTPQSRAAGMHLTNIMQNTE